MLRNLLLLPTLFFVLLAGMYVVMTGETHAQFSASTQQATASEEQSNLSLAESPTATREICSALTGRVPMRGRSGIEIAMLQRFLKQEGFLQAEATGYFGSLTEEALAGFQITVGVVARRADGGVFGPRTREYVRGRWCAEAALRPRTVLPASLACPNPPLPALSCDGRWEKFFNNEQCHMGWTCVVTKSVETNKAPVISALVGPTVLKQNDTGTWKITASDPENNSLLYSVVWGDEGASTATLLNIAQEGTPYNVNTTVSHAYANSGAYTIVVFAKDAAGNIVKATLPIVVYEPLPPAPSTTSPVPTPAPTPTLKANASCTLLGQTFPHGTTLPFGLLGGYNVRSQMAIPVSMMQLCVACNRYSAQYQCQNGEWVRMGNAYPYPYPIALKPVIYLYPTSTQSISVQLSFKGALAYTYPPYDADIKGWKVRAHPDGTLINLADGKEYSYLFWEGKAYDLKVDETKGFVVKGSNTREFLQTKLAELGLTPREYNEFIVFWLPKMQDNPYNFINFVGDEYIQSAPLTVSPSPDSILRVFMAFKPLSQYQKVTPQKIEQFERKGFSVIEWGGMQIAE